MALADGVVVGFQSVGKSETLPAGYGEMRTSAARALGLTQINALIYIYNLDGLACYSRMGLIGISPAPPHPEIRAGYRAGGHTL